MVPCPHCGKPNDLRELAGQNLLDTGHNITCGAVNGNNIVSGHCGRIFQITRIQPVTMVQVRPMHQTLMQLSPGTGPPPPTRAIGRPPLRRLPGR